MEHLTTDQEAVGSTPTVDTMGDKSGLCLWCGRWTESRAEDGLADCDRPECIARRDYSGETITSKRTPVRAQAPLASMANALDL